LLDKEMDATLSTSEVKWQRFEYLNVKQSDGQEKRKLQLVLKETACGDILKYLMELLKTFPAHQFCASWQDEQLERLLDNLPQYHICCIHGHSENYYCSNS